MLAGIKHSAHARCNQSKKSAEIKPESKEDMQGLQPTLRGVLLGDDLRTRRGRPAFRVGAWDRNGREHGKDSADDHILHKTESESVREGRYAQSPSGEALAKAGAIFSADFEMFRESVPSAPQ